MPTDTSSVRLRGVGRVFGSTTAVEGLDLDVGRGEFFSVLGPSGCGKTTVLRMIAGLLPADRGRICIEGVDVTTLPAHRRPVNTVFQDYGLFPHLDVAGNVGFGLREKGIRGAKARSRVEAMLDLVGLTGRERAHPAQLSGGQRQRVALARALILDPQVLLLDEPLAALDLSLRRQMQTLLKRLNRDTGVTFVFVTHDQNEAFALSDRIAVMASGRVQQVADPVTVYRMPVNGFVASFVGEVNRLPGRAMSTIGTHRHQVRLAGGGEVTVPGSIEVISGHEVEVLVRPEDVDVRLPGDRSASPEEVRIAGTLTETVFLGHRVKATVRTSDGMTISVSLGPRAVGDLNPGDSVNAFWCPANSWVLPRDDGSPSIGGGSDPGEAPIEAR